MNLGERYQVQDPIGRGVAATVYRGIDRQSDRAIAIKVLRDLYSADFKFIKRFQQQARITMSLQHPNIVQVYDYGQFDGNYFTVMEFVDGTDLRRYLRSRGVLDIERAVIIVHDVALALGTAHDKGIIHRNAFHQNILLEHSDTVKLTGFGSVSAGTVHYFSPEQAQGYVLTPASDVYTLGVILYEMVTGRTPFDGDTPVETAMKHIQETPAPPGQFNQKIPPALEEIILRCLEKVPELRYVNGSQLARALENL